MSEVIGFRTFDRPIRNNSIHDVCYPLDVYPNQMISCKIRLQEHSPYSRTMPVFRISPFGVEVDTANLKGLLLELEIGMRVDVQLQIGNREYEFPGLKIETLVKEGSRQFLGVRWDSTSSTENLKSDLLWKCNEDFLPTGLFRSEARLNEDVYFKVKSISNAGMEISTSLRNKLIFPQMSFRASISFPLGNAVSTLLKVVRISYRKQNNKLELYAMLQILENNFELLETIGQYLFQFGENVSIKQIRDAGMKIKSAESGIDFSFVKTPDDYRTVLKLRRLAYSMAGKTTSTVTDEQMGDLFDAKGRILMAKHKGTLVGSLRIMFHSDNDPCEYDNFVNIPSSFPKRSNAVVSSRVCTHPEYRGSDLVYGLIRQLVLTAVQSKRRYILGGCTDELLPLYKKLGLKGTGVRFQHNSLNGVSEQLILGDVVGMLSGADVSFQIWRRLFSDLSSFITSQYELPMDPVANFRLNLYRSCLPLTKH